MKSTIMTLTFVSLLTLLTSGCGSGEAGRAQENPSGNSGNGGGGIVAGSVEPSLNIKTVNSTVQFEFELMNQTERIVTYHFNTSQRFDYVIKTPEGETVKKFSEGMAFTQVLGTVKLKQAERVTFNTEVADLKPGKYTVTFWLTANEEQPKVTKTFEVK